MTQKEFKFPDGKIIAFYADEKLQYLELTGDFQSSVKSVLFSDSLAALKEVFLKLNI